jgi:hypothetical protein
MNARKRPLIAKFRVINSNFGEKVTSKTRKGGTIAGIGRAVHAFKKTETSTGRDQTRLCGRYTHIAKDMPTCWQVVATMSLFQRGVGNPAQR